MKKNLYIILLFCALASIPLQAVEIINNTNSSILLQDFEYLDGKELCMKPVELAPTQRWEDTTVKSFTAKINDKEKFRLEDLKPTTIVCFSEDDNLLIKISEKESEGSTINKKNTHEDNSKSSKDSEKDNELVFVRNPFIPEPEDDSEVFMCHNYVCVPRSYASSLALMRVIQSKPENYLKNLMEYCIMYS